MSQSPIKIAPASSVPGRRFNPNAKRWLAGLGLLGLLLLTLPVIRSRSAAQSETESVATDGVLPVETLRATQVSSYDVSRSYTGEIAAPQSSDLGFERSGQLTALLVPEGGRVQSGDPIARLDTRNLQTQRQQIEAEKAGALAQLSELETGARTEEIAAATAVVQDLEAQIALQRTQLARREVLYERGAISQEALDEFSFGEGSLQGKLDQARSQLSQLQNGTRPEKINAQTAVIQQLDARLADLDVTISKSTLNAPFSGTIAEHIVDLGTVVGAGQSVIRLVENDIPEARVGVPVGDIQKISIGEERTVAVNGEQYTGTVTSILPEVDSQTRTQTVVLTLEPRAVGQVSPGQTVRLNLSERIAAQGIWVPAEALTQGIRGLWTAYVVVPDSADPNSADSAEDGAFVVEPHSVEIVHQEGDRVLVTGTIQPNDVVVASGSHRLVPGQSVRLSAANTQDFVSD